MSENRAEACYAVRCLIINRLAPALLRSGSPGGRYRAIQALDKVYQGYWMAETVYATTGQREVYRACWEPPVGTPWSQLGQWLTKLWGQ